MNRHDAQSYLEMAADRVRTFGYRDAIQRACPGKVVLDLGAGTGLLSLLALQAGAKLVYGVESDRDALAVAMRAVTDNGFSERFVPVGCLSTKMEILPSQPQPEVLVGEVFDSTGIGENGPFFLFDAARRLCASDAQVIPSRLECYVCLAAKTSPDRSRDDWNRVGELLGLDLSANLGAPYGDQADLLPMTAWTVWQRVRLGQQDFEPRCLVPFEIASDGLVEGLGTAFELDLGAGARRLTADSWYPQPLVWHLSTLSSDTHWRKGFYPLPAPLEVRKGDRVLLETAFSGSGQAKLRFGWSIRKYAAGSWPEEPALRDILASGQARVIYFRGGVADFRALSSW